MPEWLFWLTLTALLAAGRIVGVGLFLDRFAVGAAAACLGALLIPFYLEQQLQLFLIASGAALAIGRFARARKSRSFDAA